MILALSTTYQPATDLGYLLRKNPSKHQTFELSQGIAHVFYPEATPERCTAVMMLEIDPVGLVRDSGTSDQYVNDRPYTANSMMSVAMSVVLRSAMNGSCKEKPELASTPIPLEIRLPVVKARGGTEAVKRFFEPLGYEIECKVLEGNTASTYVDLTLRATKTVAETLCHLYVLIPVLDGSKHYWVEQSEVDKLLTKGEGWLEKHPAKEQIVRTYLKRGKSLVREALARLKDVEEEPAEEEEEAATETPTTEEKIEKPLSLNQQRMQAVVEALKEVGAKQVVDLGCGEGNLLYHLLKTKSIDKIIGMDVSIASLEKASRNLHLDKMTPHQRERIELLHGSLVYRDRRLEGYDAAALVEVIEHLDEPRLKALERVVFEFARPASVVITTPNREYNVLFKNLEGKLRHNDHRFEWTRAEFQEWSSRIASAYEYSVAFSDIGDKDETLGSPTQMALFRRSA